MDYLKSYIASIVSNLKPGVEVVDETTPEPNGDKLRVALRSTHEIEESDVKVSLPPLSLRVLMYLNETAFIIPPELEDVPFIPVQGESEEQRLARLKRVSILRKEYLDYDKTVRSGKYVKFEVDNGTGSVQSPPPGASPSTSPDPELSSPVRDPLESVFEIRTQPLDFGFLNIQYENYPYPKDTNTTTIAVEARFSEPELGNTFSLLERFYYNKQLQVRLSGGNKSPASLAANEVDSEFTSLRSSSSSSSHSPFRTFESEPGQGTGTGTEGQGQGQGEGEGTEGGTGTFNDKCYLQTLLNKILVKVPIPAGDPSSPIVNFNSIDYSTYSMEEMYV